MEGILGRDQELEALDEASAAARLVCVTGAPGVGKSRLVAAWAERRALGADSVVLCRVEGASSRAELEAKLAQALDVPLPGTASPFEVVLAGHGATTLVLDGIDRLPPADLGAALHAWLAAAPGLRLITSGRGGVAGAQPLQVAPLGVDAAAALFVERARAAGHTPRNTALERRSITELVERLDGLPLAIVLAAARAGVLSPTQILQRLGRERAVAPQHDGLSLHAAFELSWTMLTALERRVLAAASCFRGAFHVSLLEMVLEQHGADVLSAFESLVAKSLVQRTDEGEVAVWFRLLETVRGFVRAQIDAAPTAEWSPPSEQDVGERITARAAALSAQLDSHEEHQALEELAALVDDLRALVDHDSEPRRTARAGLALAAWGVPRGAMTLDALEATARAAADDTDAEVRLLARYWLARGQIRAGAVLQAGSELARALDDAELSAWPMVHARLEILQAHLALERGELASVESSLGAVAARLEGLGAWFLEGELFNLRGRLAEARGAIDAAAEAFVAARALYRRVGALRQAGRALQNLAIVRDAQGRHEEARVRFEEALAEHVEARDPAGVADNLLNTGSLHLSTGDLDIAEELMGRALDEERRLGNRRFEGLALANLGLVAHVRGDLPRAQQQYLHALAIFQEAHDRRFEAVIELFLGGVHAELGARRQAERAFAATAEALARTPDPGFERVAYTLQALLLGGEALETRLGQAREALAAGALRGGELALAVRILARALARHDSQSPAAGERLQVGPEARWFERGGQARVELETRPSLRGVLAALVEAGPRALPQEALFRAGWPGERVLPLAARDRVYTAVRTLRRLGLDGVLARRDDGYYLQGMVEKVAC